MKILFRKLILGAVAIATVLWMGPAQSGFAAPQAGEEAQAPRNKAMTSEQAFKNIQALKGIPVDDFMGTMGIMTDALGFDCSECHLAAGTDQVNWAFDTPRKVTARKMVQMVTTINQTNFSGRQLVTCWSCHRGRDRPLTTPTMDIVYGTPRLESDDILTSVPGQPSAEQVLEKYIQALGGAQRLGGLASFVGEGKSAGFGGFGGEGDVQLYARVPDQRTLVMVYKDAPGRGDTTRSYDGKAGWLRTPLNVLGEYQLSGGELDGARLDALLSFPGQIKQIFTGLRTGSPTTISDLPAPSSQTALQSSVMVGEDRPVNVVQGSGPRGLLATMYFDKESGLLLRVVRYSKSPIGRVPTQIDFADYRDVGGIKFPFRMTFAWLDGRDAIQLTQIRTNVPIDPAKFGRPPALTKP